MWTVMISDTHIHTSYSSDCETPMEDMIRTGIDRGLKIMCFTEHMDKDYPLPPDAKDGDPGFFVDTEAYHKGYLAMKEKYAGKIDLLFVIELGLQPHIVDWNKNYVNQHDFDYIIGSAHTIDRRDPYFPEFYEGRSEREAYEQYFEEALRDILLFDDFDSFGHLDYIVRYGPNKNKCYSYKAYSDHIDPILRTLIEKGIALEVNAGGYRNGLGVPNPDKDVILRYKELGGELITVGSDAHTTENLAKNLDRIEDLLIECGFKNHVIYIGRKPVFYPLG